ncbi:MAG: hypothetical protein KA956_02535 [Pyrinomonadaceae bacterium]|nr:hypothetical protein [Acidobacteriota bacterium]MBK7932230.1 hypothetical protein [Acidobacteriota bacterium]MBP7375335.1 hypothetical protein [Pyrinomonadaceae bacterium]MBP7476827.1 hypothetical protein [Pyrinomonadaceae bacterium]
MRIIILCFALAIVSLTSTARAQSIEDDVNYSRFKGWAINTQEPNPLPVMFDRCIEYYDKMIASGISPDTQVQEYVMEATYGFPRIHWKGTIKEIKENWCDVGQKKLTGDIESKHAPYKAALKADKLRLVINEKTGMVYSYALAGGKYTSDAKQLATARVWFLDIGAATNETRICRNGGKLSSVRRYSFDVNHKLLGTTEKEYCGTPPASAYR